MPRIVSFLPAATEIACALGAGAELVGRSHECDYPPEVRDLPVVSKPALALDGLSQKDIDRAVAAHLATGESLYQVDERLLDELKPDIVLTQDLCQVCAVSSRDDALCALQVETLALDAHSVGEIEQSIFRLAARLGLPARGRAVVEAMESKIQATGARVRDLEPRRVFVSEWLELLPYGLVPEVDYYPCLSWLKFQLVPFEHQVVAFQVG